MISGNVDTHMGNGISVNKYNSNQRIYWEGKCGNSVLTGCWVDAYLETKNGSVWSDKKFFKTINNIDEPQFHWLDYKTVEELSSEIIFKVN